MKFYKCEHCGNIIEMVHDKGVRPSCCNAPMKELIPNSVDASNEKHVPLIKEEEGKVIVHIGEVDHPMLPEHYIEWVMIHTDRGVQRKNLHPGGQPFVEFPLLDDEIVLSAYAYCNIHGLWKKISE